MAADIPRIIWQTHEWEYSDLPTHLLATSLTWRNLNPTWVYKYVSAADRDRYIQRFDRDLYRFYLLADKVTQSDIWRYASLYQFGGFYADMDSVCKMPLDYLLDTYRTDEEVIATEPNHQEGINNANIGAIQGSKIAKAILKGIQENHEQLDFYHMLLESPDKEVFWERIAKEIKTSPDNYSKVLEQNMDKVCFVDYIASHGDTFKHGFRDDYKVDYYGTLVSYAKLAKQNHWVTYS